MKENIYFSLVKGVSTSDIFNALNSIGRYHPGHCGVTFGDGCNSFYIDIDTKGSDTFVNVHYNILGMWDCLSDTDFRVRDFLEASISVVESTFGPGHFAGFTYDLKKSGFKAFMHFCRLY